MISRIGTTIAVVAMFLFASNVFAQKKIVVPTDFSSIQKAIDEASDHDTVWVQNGIYKESIMLKDYVVVIGQDAEQTIIRGNGMKPVVEGANYSVLKNFTIENGSTGIICKNTNPIIEHTIVRDNKNTGIHCLISLPEIKNNLIYNNKWSGIFCELISSTQRTSINHNFIAENGYSGIMLANRSEVLIENNAIVANKQYGIYVNEDSRRSRIVYNDFFNNRSPFNSYAVINETNISKDPVLASGDYKAFTTLAGKNAGLKGMGKDGLDIGPLTESLLITNDKKKTDEMKGTLRDRDNDGIPDIYDQCQEQPEDFDGYQDQDGCPDSDNDKDGVPDVSDRCPNFPEDFNGYLDEDGCPDGGKPATNNPDSLQKATTPQQSIPKK